jgi:hypothetical protein
MAKTKEPWAMSFVIVGVAILYTLSSFLLGILMYGLFEGFPAERMTTQNVGPYVVGVAIAIPLVRVCIAIKDWFSGRVRVTITRQDPPEPGDWR